MIRKKKPGEERLILDMRDFDENSESSEDKKDLKSSRLAEEVQNSIMNAEIDKGGSDTQNSKNERKLENSSNKTGSNSFGGLFFAKLKKYSNIIFIDGLSGMALGLFATLIIGTILSQIGKYVGDNFVGNSLVLIGTAAKILLGPGIGVGVACKFKKPPLLTISAGVAGFIGAQAENILSIAKSGAITTLSFGVAGEPVGAFVAAMVAIGIGSLVAGKTKMDIVLTPLVAIISGAIAGLLVGPPISAGMKAIGEAITWAMDQNKIIMGVIIAVLMGMALTLPISSAALGVSLQLAGIASGAATVGCCCQMVGFAVASFRENKWGGLVAQGLGTSMLQMPNIIKKPRIWLPAIIASAILGPVSSAVFGMINNPIGSGMGTAGLVGPLMAFETMTAAGVSPVYTFIQIALMHFLLPAVICLSISEIMRKVGYIKRNDMLLSIN